MLFQAETLTIGVSRRRQRRRGQRTAKLLRVGVYMIFQVFDKSADFRWVCCHVSKCHSSVADYCCSRVPHLRTLQQLTRDVRCTRLKNKRSVPKSRKLRLIRRKFSKTIWNDKNKTEHLANKVTVICTSRRRNLRYPCSLVYRKSNS